MSRTERLRIAPWSNHAHRDVFLQKSSQDYLISSIGSDKQSNTWCASCPLAATNNQTHGVGMKTVGNGRENPSTVPATVFFGREWKRERKNRTGKRNRYYGISGTESIGREHADYNRESITQNGKIHTTTSNI